MARKFLNSIDLAKTELQNARIQNLASAPSGPVEGLVYYDTTLHQFGYYNGTAWQYGASLTFGAPTASAPGDAQLTGSTGNVSDAGHRHAREAFAAPTAETTYGSSSAAGTAATIPRSDHAHGNPTHVDADHSGIHLSALAAPTADVSMGSHKLINVTDPSSNQDAATKGYVDSVAQGVTAKAEVAYATTAALAANTYANGTLGVGATLTGNTNGALAAIDGQTPAANDRVLVKNEATQANNGIYTVTQVGDGSHPYILTRVTDMDQAAEFKGAFVFVLNGTTSAQQGFICNIAAVPTVGTTAITFVQFSGVADITAGNGLTKSGNSIAVQPGSGVIADGTSIRVDKTVVMTRFAQDVGDGSSTSITVTHNLGTLDVIVQLYDKTSPNSQLECDVQHTSTTAITLLFATAPASNQYRVVVIG